MDDAFELRVSAGACECFQSDFGLCDFTGSGDNSTIIFICQAAWYAVSCFSETSVVKLRREDYGGNGSR